jgi:threonine aldolase
VTRLADDHALAQRLAQGLAGIEGLSVRSASTNIVFVDVAEGRGCCWSTWPRAASWPPG